MAHKAAKASAAQGLFAKGLAAHQQGRLAEAKKYYQQILRQLPNDVNALHMLGLASVQTQHVTWGVELLHKAVALHPNAAELHGNLGFGLQAAGRHSDAVASFDTAIALNPGYVEAYSNRGISLGALQRHAEAVASFDRAIALNPTNASTHCKRGDALAALARYADAVASYDTAITLTPGVSDAFINRGNVLTKLKRHAEALASYDRAIALGPLLADAHCNRGNALRRLGRQEAAMASYDRAITLLAVFAPAHSNRGLTLHDLARHQEALASYDRAIACQPDFAEAHRNKAQILLMLGRFAEGWEEQEWRKRLDEPLGQRTYAQPEWLGQDSIAGKTLFIHAEQGFGDTIQFCRYASLVRALGAKVILSVQDPLLRLIKGMDADIRVIGAQETPADFDRHCALMSLPLALRTTLESIPAAPQYLWAEEKPRSDWLQRLGPKTKPRIGLAWSGNPEHNNDHNRSIALADMQPLLSPQAEWIALQKDIRPADRMVLVSEPRIIVPAELGDFSDTAALIDAMDMVISVDTSVAHLAAAMGKPTWILLPHVAEWRWLLDRTDSPWYPSARLFRQHTRTDWTGLIAEVRTHMSAH